MLNFDLDYIGCEPHYTRFTLMLYLCLYIGNMPPQHMIYVGHIDILGISPNAQVLLYDYILGIGLVGQGLLLLY